MIKLRLGLEKAFKIIKNNKTEEKDTKENFYEQEDNLFKNPPKWSVIAQYKIGPVNYYVYRGEDNLVHLYINEPKIEMNIDLLTGLKKDTNEEERYLINKYKSGYGKIYPLIIDPHIDEISYNGYTNNISAIHKLVPSRWIMVDIKLEKEESDSLVIELARKANKVVSLTTPYIEGITDDGNRISVSFLNEISHFGSNFVLRKYPEKPLTMSDLLASKVLSPIIAAYIWLLAEAQGFLIISGSMGSGKTTLLQSIASLLPPYSKIITIEDTPELKLISPNWDSFITRPKLPGSEVEEINMEDLLKYALRRRADYVIVGEVRGREAKVLAQAATSGYGAMTTIHSDSPEGVISRLTLEPIKLPSLFIKSITAIIQIRTLPSLGGKAIRRLYEIDEVDDEELLNIYKLGYQTNDIDNIVRKSKKLEIASNRLGFNYNEISEEMKSRIEFLENTIGKSPEDFYVSLSRYYVEKYGDVL
ncbi:type II/IV secretion system ATPase subunit [Caldisphaera sp.]|uniref:type II/IV secretion system ATPase subunit n=1 Tax=Caldisphaera sp. TaxID=2060322 RepID=UPI0025BE6AAC|nr:type II/IV secretion system ATPase subunit [Caldisphaera sp.]